MVERELDLGQGSVYLSSAASDLCGAVLRCFEMASYEFDICNSTLVSQSIGFPFFESTIHSKQHFPLLTPAAELRSFKSEISQRRGVERSPLSAPAIPIVLSHHQLQDIFPM